MKYYAEYPFDDEPATKLVRVDDAGVSAYWHEPRQEWVTAPRFTGELIMNPDFEPVTETDLPRVMREVGLVQIG